MQCRLVMILVVHGTLMGAACMGSLSSPIEPGEPVGGAPGVVPASPPASGALDPGMPAAPKGPSEALPRGGSPICTNVNPGPSPLRRLSHTEYENSVRDLFGTPIVSAKDLPPDLSAFGFDNTAAVLSVNGVLAESYTRAAEKIAATATSARTLPTLLACDAVKMGSEVCLTGFFDGLGRRIWRRPLGDTDRKALEQVFALGRDLSAAGGFVGGLAAVIQVMVMSPQFLYRFEGSAPPGTTPIKLSSWDVATRLSYLLWQSTPDNQLLDAARADKLTKREEILAEAKRMLADPRTQATTLQFHRSWLGIGDPRTLAKDRDRFAGFSDDTMPKLAVTELDRFAEEVIWRGDGKLETLLTAPFSFMNKKLAAYYGVTGPAADTFDRVTLDPARRAGFLTQAAVLAAHSGFSENNVVRRGAFIRKQLLCTVPPPPPPGTETKPPPNSDKMTARELAIRHRADPACSGCHQLMDPLGFGLENYDAAGGYRTVDKGKPVDATGVAVSRDLSPPTFTGAVELARRLGRSRDAHSCFATQWFRFAHGRDATAPDGCSIDLLTTAITTGNVRELLLALTQTDAFLYRGGTP